MWWGVFGDSSINLNNGDKSERISKKGNVLTKDMLWILSINREIAPGKLKEKT